MHRSYRVALICGALPMIVGVAIFLLWMLTRWDWLVTVGFYTLFSGVVIFLIGFAALTRFYILALRTQEITRPRLFISTLGCAILLFSNFVAAGVILYCSNAILSSYTVIVHNTSQQPLTSVRIVGGGCDELLGAISPGGIVRRSFWIQHEGDLAIQIGGGPQTIQKSIDGYVTPGLGVETTVTFNSDTTITVSNE